MTRALSALVAGALFAAGLILGGLTRPAKVLGFLDLTGRWDPSLGLVMVSALLVYATLYRLILRRSAPLLDGRFHLPTRRDIDGRLLAGAALFGVGWGLAGHCPGPAIAGALTGLRPLLFVAAMVAGMSLRRPGA